MLPRQARCVLSRLRCNEHSLLLSSYLSRIGRIENSSCNACGHSSQDISHLILHCPASDSAPLTLWRLCLTTTSDPSPGELPGFWGSMVFRHAPIPRKGLGDNNNNTAQILDVHQFLLRIPPNIMISLTLSMRHVFPEKVPFVLFFYASDFCHVELREYIRQTSCTCTDEILFFLYFYVVYTEQMDLENVDLRGSTFKVLNSKCNRYH